MQHYPLPLVAAVISLLAACGEPAAPPATPADAAKAAPASTDSTTPLSSTEAPVVKEGEPCGDGMAGRPKAVCATGLVCELNVTAPTPPPGAQSAAPPGKCRKKSS